MIPGLRPKFTPGLALSPTLPNCSRPQRPSNTRETTMASLTLSQIRKSFGNLEVLHGIDLSIEAGEFVVFVGPSGCGKSTLLRTIAGLEEVSGGRIEIGGNSVNDVTPAKRGLAMVFQSYALYPHMNVYDNMAFGLKLAKAPKSEIRAKVMDAARMLQLEPLLERYPRQL